MLKSSDEIIHQFKGLYPRNWPISYLNDSETQERAIKIQRNSRGSMLPDSPRSLRLRRSFSWEIGQYLS